MVYLLSFDRMSDTNDAAQDSGCRGCVVPVTAVAAEPEQDEQNGQKERAAQSYECYQPRVLEVYTRSIITNLLHRSQQELRCRSETASYRKHRQSREFSWRKIVRKSREYPNALWYTGIFGRVVYNRMQTNIVSELVNAWCNFDRRSCRSQKHNAGRPLTVIPNCRHICRNWHILSEVVNFMK